jgi:hypothetical protein
MSEINYEKVDDIVVLRVIGAVTFTQITDAMNQYFPLISKHLIWDYTEGDLENVSPLDFSKVPDISKKLFTNRLHGGRTAFVCPADYLYGMFRMYTAYADIQAMPYEYDVCKSFREAVVWVGNSK